MSKENKTINRKILSDALRAKRKKLGLSQRAVERETGVAASTISRIENLVGTPDADIIGVLTEWLEMPIERVMQTQNSEAVTFYPNETTPEIVAEHLRKDKNLSPKAAAGLSELFRVAYAQMTEFQDAD